MIIINGYAAWLGQGVYYIGDENARSWIAAWSAAIACPLRNTSAAKKIDLLKIFIADFPLICRCTFQGSHYSN